MLYISSQEEYGIRLLVHLANNKSQVSSLADIAEAEKISLAYIRKIFNLLKKENLVISTRGSKGGYELSRPASEISLADIFKALQTHKQYFNCSDFSGEDDKCVHLTNCSIRGLLGFIEKQVINSLNTVSLEELAASEEKEINNILKEKVKCH